MTKETVAIVGSGAEDDPYRPDYSGDYDNAQYDHANGEVSIEVKAS